jgi:hypothetical protein
MPRVFTSGARDLACDIRAAGARSFARPENGLAQDVDLEEFKLTHY